MWIEFEGLADATEVWRAQVTGFVMNVANELEYNKEKLKKWDKDVFGGIKAQKYNLLGIINSLDVKEASHLVFLAMNFNKGKWQKMTWPKLLSGWKSKYLLLGWGN